MMPDPPPRPSPTRYPLTPRESKSCGEGCDRRLGDHHRRSCAFYVDRCYGLAAGRWRWCRRHAQSVPVGMKCSDGGRPAHWFPLDTCVRVGPFMSEREANRLGDSTLNTALGMEVEW